MESAPSETNHHRALPEGINIVKCRFRSIMSERGPAHLRRILLAIGLAAASVLVFLLLAALGVCGFHAGVPSEGLPGGGLRQV